MQGASPLQGLLLVVLGLDSGFWVVLSGLGVLGLPGSGQGFAFRVSIQRSEHVYRKQQYAFQATCIAKPCSLDRSELAM